MSTPTCPGCGAKFSHDSRALACKKCGLPDEIAGRGGRLLSRWKKQHGYKKSRVSIMNKKRRQHGRAR